MLQEFYVNVTRKIARPMTEDEAAVAVSKYAHWATAATDARDVQSAIALARQRRMSLWDALIVVAALKCDADVLWTEDLQHGASLEAYRCGIPSWMNRSQGPAKAGRRDARAVHHYRHAALRVSRHVHVASSPATGRARARSPHSSWGFWSRRLAPFASATHRHGPGHWAARSSRTSSALPCRYGTTSASAPWSTYPTKHPAAEPCAGRSRASPTGIWARGSGASSGAGICPAASGYPWRWRGA